MEKPKKENKHTPCLDKNCSWCCSPVKIPFRKGTPNPEDAVIPVDEKGKKI